ncbi:MAG: hypothetical protein OI74_04670 [Gammaproteobacteria bacterium (ex Lamellibrachia satsuma)]|nr:MAG: hypothetical protein HPY30_04535 [Gammaproteobacteria bacterium (ex Lamellibrachia satsuma)]RRS34699.1 MAG: hypothetical protein OI74_04670 [Gammaproteobacteria bacterium (ex Lamellibrachia satsuma)]RRS35264.1 MAG: hypothetical protein NV67_10900 [Gammaproteobacteria bacterium (ex Lamellibrachia satsuma)]
MLLNLIIGEYSMDMEIQENYLETMTDSFDKMDQDMSQGVQLGQQWVEKPTQLQRCQVAADKLLSAIENHNETLAMLTGGYIASHLSGIKQIKINTDGEPAGTEFH